MMGALGAWSSGEYRYKTLWFSVDTVEYFTDNYLTLPRGEKLVAYSTVATIRTIEVKMRDIIFQVLKRITRMNTINRNATRSRRSVLFATTATKRRILAQTSASRLVHRSSVVEVHLNMTSSFKGVSNSCGSQFQYFSLWPEQKNERYTDFRGVFGFRIQNLEH